jgi:tRNA-modifying protein YgfZ
VDVATYAAELDALDGSRAVLPTTGWTVTRVSGHDAVAWLNDLVTADVERLGPGEVVRSLLLSPTGRVQADALVAREPEALLMLQSPGQPRALADLLAPYVLSSDVALDGPAGDVVLVGGADGWRLAGRPPPGHVIVSEPAFEAWRIRRGIARFPVDLDEASLPAEADLDREPVIDRGKGCYLGQEAVAKIRNLGHPPRLVVPATIDGPAAAGDAIRSGTDIVGVVTSLEGATGIVRIHWAARNLAVETERGTPVSASHHPSG